MTLVQNGISKNITLEVEACEILVSLAKGKKAQGALLSTLLRQEEQRRIVARQLRQLVATVGEVGEE